MAEQKNSPKEAKQSYADRVAEKLIEQLQAGTAPWQKPWTADELADRAPYNLKTGDTYKGANNLWLTMAGYSDPRWITYNQAADMGAQVNKGEKGTLIQYWQWKETRPVTDDNGKPVLDAQGKPIKQTYALERPRLFTAVVFNAEQIDGLPPLTPRVAASWDAQERAEEILQKSGATITHKAGDRAFYRPSTDTIQLPNREQFDSADKYYSTALHELGHWTGHETRLNRDLKHPFGSEGYAKEELRAEIASYMLGQDLRIGFDPGQHASYVGSWIKALKEDPKEIFRAAADAEKIKGFVLGLAQQQEQTQEQANTTAQ